MLAHWPAGRRIAASALICGTLTVVVATIVRGFSHDFMIRLVQGVCIAAGAVLVLALFLSLITGRLADYRDPEDEAEFEALVRRSEQLARDNLAADPDENEFLALDPHDPEDFETLVREALDDLPDLLIKALDHVAVVIADDGRRHRADGV